MYLCGWQDHLHGLHHAAVLHTHVHVRGGRRVRARLLDRHAGAVISEHPAAACPYQQERAGRHL